MIEMLNWLKNHIKLRLLKKKNVFADSKTKINYSVISKTNKSFPNVIKNSNVEIAEMGCGCFIENATFYGNIILGDFVSVSGPGTIIHSEIGKIQIGSFSSIAENVSIQEFNHDSGLITTSSLVSSLFGQKHKDRFVSKGDIVIEEDVWIGSNAIVLSGVRIGRGSIIGAGAVVTQDVPKYSVVVGNPGRVIKSRFSEKQISMLEELKWWCWTPEKIAEEKEMFSHKIGDALND